MRKSLSTISRLAPVMGAPVALILLIIAGSFASPHFLSTANFINILKQNAAVGIVAVGMTLVIIQGGIDLSVGAMVAFLGGTAILAMNKAAESLSPALAIFVAVAVCLLGGLILGTVNGLLITKGRLAPFIATLGAMGILRSLAITRADGGEFRSSVSQYGDIGSGGIPFFGSLTLFYSILVFIAVTVIAEVVLKRTAFGTGIFALGDNERAARYAALRTDRTRTFVYAISGLCCGIAALLVSSRLNSVSSSMTGSMLELDAIAAVVVGGASMRGGRGSVLATFIGVLILGIINNILNMIGTDTLKSWGLGTLNLTHLQGLIKGVIVIAAVLVQRPARD